MEGDVITQHQTRKRVLIDARKIRDGGIGVYIQNLIEGLLEEDSADLSLITSQPLNGDFSWSNQVKIIVDHAEPYSLDEFFFMPKRVDTRAFDLFHVPHFTLPYGIKCPTIITVHDLIHITHPEKFYYPVIAKRLIRSACKRADGIICVSNSTLHDLNNLMRRSTQFLSKTRVVPNALNPSFQKSRDPKDYLAGRFQIKDPFFLAVASMLKPHKGVADLIPAFLKFKRKLREGNGELRKFDDIRLVLVGYGTERVVEEEELFKEIGNGQGVHLLGAVSNNDLANLYSGAEALIVPSKAEGFCLPVLEAQASGTSVIARPVPAILELLTDNDVACKNMSQSALEAGMRNCLQKKLNAESFDNTLNNKHVSRFDRQVVTKEILRVYEDTLNIVRHTKK